MRVFKVADGTSWTARLDEGSEEPGAHRAGYDTILFEPDPVASLLRLVYRPAGWLSGASAQELAAALDEAVVVRARWGGSDAAQA